MLVNAVRRQLLRVMFLVCLGRRFRYKIQSSLSFHKHIARAWDVAALADTTEEAVPAPESLWAPNRRAADDGRRASNFAWFARTPKHRMSRAVTASAETLAKLENHTPP